MNKKAGVAIGLGIASAAAFAIWKGKGAEAAPPEEPEEPQEGLSIDNIIVSPTVLTSALSEYSTIMGIGHWGDAFNIDISFSNILDTDIWVRPDYALGKLNGSPLEIMREGKVKGFDAKKLLYFRLLLSGYVEGDYSYTTDWQSPFNAKGENKLSNMVLGIYDPDDVPRTIGASDYWLKIPPGGSLTATKEAHLGELQLVYRCKQCGEILAFSTAAAVAHYKEVHGQDIYTGYGVMGYVDMVRVPPGGFPAVFDLCVAAWKAYYFIYDPSYGQQRVGSEWITVNWRPVEIVPVAVVIPDLIEIVPT